MNKKIAHAIAPFIMDKIGLSFAQTVQALLTFHKMRQPYETIHRMVCNKRISVADREDVLNDKLDFPSLEAVTQAWNKSYAFAATLEELKPHYNELYKTAPDPKMFQNNDRSDPSVDAPRQAPRVEKRKSKRVKTGSSNV